VPHSAAGAAISLSLGTDTTMPMVTSSIQQLLLGKKLEAAERPSNVTQ